MEIFESETFDESAEGLTRFSRRTALKGLLAAGGAIATAGAASTLPASASTRAIPRILRPRSTTSQLLVAAPGPINSLDFHTTQALGYFPNDRMIGSIYSSLLDFSLPASLTPSQANNYRTHGLPVNPDLASGYSVSADGLTYTFALRKGVMSNFGNEMTSADVIWSFTKALAAKQVATFQAFLCGWTSMSQVSAPDRYTVAITLSEAITLLPQLLGTTGFCIFDSTEAKQHATSADPYASTWLSSNVATFGPYVVEQFAPGGNTVVLGPQPHYWGAKPIPRVVYTAVPDGGARLELFERGDVNYVEGLSQQQLAAVRRRSSEYVQHAVSANAALLFLDYTTKPWNIRSVRQGIAYAIPYRQIIQSVYANNPYVKQMKSLFVPFTQGYTDKYGYTQDLRKAAQLLKPAMGHTLTIPYNSDLDTDRETVLLIQSALNSIGMTVEALGLSTADWNTKLRSGHLPTTFDSLDTPEVPTPYYYSFLYLTSTAFVNYMKYKNPQVDAITKSLSTEQDPAKVVVYSEELQRIAMRDLPVIPIVWTGADFGLAKGLKLRETQTGNAVTLFWQLRSS
jgi:peptide/nickel transport system substrate-binding protein